MSSRQRCIPALALALLLGACAREPASPAERGRATFVRICSGCHGMDGRGAPRVAWNAPAPPRDLTDPAFHAERSDEQLLFVLRNGKGAMPPFAAILEDAQLRDVIAYVRSLPKASSP